MKKCSIKSGEVSILYVFHVALFFCDLFFGIICNFDLPSRGIFRKISPRNDRYHPLGNITSNFPCSRCINDDVLTLKFGSK